MLPNLLPGLREIRAPVISGYLWLAFFYLLFRSDLPSRSNPGSVLKPVFEIAEDLSILGLATVASIAAYLTGSAMQELLKLAGRLVSPDRPLYGEAGTHLSANGRKDVKAFVELRLQHVRRRLHQLALAPGEQGVDEEPSVALVERELPLVRTLLLGDRPELVGELDRLQSEADLRIAVAVPLAAFSLYLAWELTPGWLTALLPAALLLAQGYQRQLEAGDLLAKALRIGKANAPALEALEGSVDGAQERTTLEGELEAELSRDGKEQNPRAAFRLGNVFVTSGNFRGAVEWFEVASKGGLVQAHAELGHACEQIEDFDGAERAYREGYERGDPKARRLLASFLGRHDRDDEAIDILKGRHGEGSMVEVEEVAIPEVIPSEENRVADYRMRMEEGDAKAAINLGLLLERRKDLEAAADALTQATKLAATDAQAWIQLGRVEVGRGRYREAKKAMTQAVFLREGQLGSRHFGLAEPLTELGRVLHLNEEFEESARRLREALSIRELDPTEDVGELWTLELLGGTLMSAGYYRQAQKQFARALSMRERMYGKDTPKAAIANASLGSVARLMGRPEQAVMLQRIALKAEEEIYGIDDLEVARTMSNLGNALRDAGEYEEALVYQERAIELAEDKLVRDHPERAQDLENIGETLLALDRLLDARSTFESAMGVLQSSPTPIRSEKGLVMRGLARSEQRLGDLDRAMRLAQGALKTQLTVHRPDHPEVAITYDVLAEICAVTGEIVEAEAYRDRAAAIREKNESE